MNICGVLVHANPTKTSTLVAALDRLDGVEVHATADGSRLVVTVEDTKTSAAIHTLAAIHRLDGVIAASLVYHHFDADEPSAAANA
ncbi:MAG: chaperone NapD [Hyphomicrobiales bacterium]|nr:chaperone NapD [Hyphomicrobiales bacterium]